MPKGTIKKLIDGSFGFIETEEEKELFFHRNDLEGVEFSSLNKGQEVEFEMGQDRKGRPAAVKVRLAHPEGDDSGDKGGDESGDESGDSSD